jgi:hypothetical protein
MQHFRPYGLVFSLQAVEPDTHGAEDFDQLSVFHFLCLTPLFPVTNRTHTPPLPVEVIGSQHP